MVSWLSVASWLGCIAVMSAAPASEATEPAPPSASTSLTFGDEPAPAPAPAPAEPPSELTFGDEAPVEPPTPAADETAPEVEASPPEPALDDELETQTTVADAEAEPEEECDGGTASFDLQPAAPSGQPGAAMRPAGRRSQWGNLWLRGGPIVGFGGVGGVGLQLLGFGIGATAFPNPYFGVGLQLEDLAAFVGPTLNLFRITPEATLLILPYRRVTPIVTAGLGGAVYSKKAGAYGRWVAGGGLMIAIAERLLFGFGFDFEGLMPRSRFYRNFECEGGGQGCHIGYGPWTRIGFRI